MPPTTNLEDADCYGLEQFDDERPSLGTELKAIVTKLMEQRILNRKTANSTVRQKQ